jgi:hypothetical protein
MTSHLIVLDVSGRKYKKQKITLQASPYFRSLLARWDQCSDKQEDDSYFIDADPDAFQYILDFMRRPAKYPLFWTKQTGFDYALYNKVESEADYFHGSYSVVKRYRNPCEVHTEAHDPVRRCKSCRKSYGLVDHNMMIQRRYSPW